MLKRFALGVGLLALSVSMGLAVLAEEGIETLDTFETKYPGLYDSSQGRANQFTGLPGYADPSFNVPLQNVMPPSMAGQASSVEPKAPWYKRFFGRQSQPQPTLPAAASKSPWSLPIYQVPKYPVDPAKSTQPLSDPLIRLTSTLQLEQSTLAPGFYILSLSSDKKQLTLNRQQKVQLSLPVSGVTVLPAVKALPGEPSVVTKGELLPSGDGKSLSFVLEQAGQRYTSIPVLLRR
jgi:hypothetical protein